MGPVVIIADAVQWCLRALPHYWTVDALWRPGPLSLFVGIALTALATTLLAVRTLSRLNAR